LDTILKNWYLELEMRRDTTRWEELNQRTRISFTFKHDSPSIGGALKAIQTKIFLEVEVGVGRIIDKTINDGGSTSMQCA
jgi:hypothetical protein